MVKLGFIVEGATETIILEKSDFFEYLRSINIDFINEVIDAGGSGNLLPHNITEYTNRLKKKGATKILILADLDDDACITITKDRIKPLAEQILIISVKKIEAWFLADSKAMGSFLRDSSYYCEFPESIAEPFTEIKNSRLARSNKGVDDKIILAKLMAAKNNFSILKAAEHPNCNSAKYFLNKIQELLPL